MEGDHGASIGGPAAASDNRSRLLKSDCAFGMSRAILDPPIGRYRQLGLLIGTLATDRRKNVYASVYPRPGRTSQKPIITAFWGILEIQVQNLE